MMCHEYGRTDRKAFADDYRSLLPLTPLMGQYLGADAAPDKATAVRPMLKRMAPSCCWTAGADYRAFLVEGVA